MQKELIQAYKNIMQLFLKAAATPEQIKIELERIEDDAQDVIESFESHNMNPPIPSHWISLLRILRMSMSLIRRIYEKYDTFVSTYSNISSKAERTPDETTLHREIGEFLYKVDDLMGNHERLLSKLLTNMKTLLIDEYGISDDPDADFYRAHIPSEAQIKIKLEIQELYALCKEVSEEMQIMLGLDRLRKLII